jgi:hypothetical protein
MKAREMETTFRFLRYAEGRNVFQFACLCGAHGELALAAERNRNELIACPQKCGAFYMTRYGCGIFSKPTLEMAITPRRPAKPEKPAARKRRRA